MKTKIVALLFAFICPFTFVAFLSTTLSAGTPPTLISEQLSDHAQSVPGVILETAASVTQNAAHFAWTEPITESFGNPDNWGLFYRRVPTGTTIHLTAVANAAGNPGSPYIQPGANDAVCVVWRDQTPGGDYYLFLWNSEIDTVTRSPNPVDSGVEFTYIPFVCDASNEPEVIWHGPDSIFVDTEIMKWDLATNQQQRISINENTFIQDVHTTIVDDVLHLAWQESGNIYLWDEVGGVAQSIYSGSAYSLYMAGDKNNVIHMFWLQSFETAPPCYRYWNSNDQAVELLMTCDDWDFAAGKDGSGNIHAAWHKSAGLTPVHYWNATENVTATITVKDSGSQAVDNMKLMAGPDHKAHIFWQGYASDNFYYWNSEEVSPTLVTMANSNIRDEQKWAFDSQGIIHTVWREETVSSPSDYHVYYWNPVSSSIKLTDSPLSYPDFLIAVDSTDKPHVAIIESGRAKFFYWESEMGSAALVNTSVMSLKGLAVARDGIYALLQTGSKNIYYWSSMDGTVAFGTGDHYSYVIDGNDDIYLYWQESGFAESEDLVAAWTNTEAYSVYLPIVTFD